MVAKRIAFPEEIIEAIGDVLDRPIVTRKGIEKEIMPKGFEDQNRALYKGIRADQIIVVPDREPGQSRKAGNDTADTQERHPQPLAFKVPA